jgi:hypothetical protein
VNRGSPYLALRLTLLPKMVHLPYTNPSIPVIV